MKSELENMDFSGYNISVAQAAKIMGKDQQYIRQGIIQGILPIGTAFKKQGSKQYDYYISPKLFYEFTGFKISDHTKIWCEFVLLVIRNTLVIHIFSQKWLK